jgi:hypothetical protein
MPLVVAETGFSVLQQREFVSAFRAIRHFTLYRRWATGTGKCSTVRYVEREAAFWTSCYVLGFRAHSKSRSLSEPLNDILKIFPETLKEFNAEILNLKVQ